jgi:ectoine hydroxylase-related dioxygenase (phytanoyl-CoA dioxygenase family)
MHKVNFSVCSATIEEFRERGFVVVGSPLTDDTLQSLRDQHDAIAPRWAATDWPDDVHKLASQFCLMGEVAFRLPEQPALLEAARHILNVDEVFVGACAAGDTVVAESVDGRPVTSLQWHAAPGRGGPTGARYEQVAFRFPMDVHDKSNGGLHLIPGSHRSDKATAEQAVRAEVARSADFFEWNGLFFGTHPNQTVLYPKPGEMIIWTPDVWHCTGANPEHRPRRSITWIYFPKNGRFRDHGTLRHVLGEEELGGWSPERRRLWGLA